MHKLTATVLSLSLAALLTASCSAASSPADSGKIAAAPGQPALATQDLGTFDEPWALAFEPGTGNLFVTERGGRIRFLQPNGRLGTVTGVPKVAYGGQGGLGDLVFAPDYAASRL